MSGARNLRRVIARRVEDPLSDLLLTGNHAGERIVLHALGSEIDIEIPHEELLPV